LAKHIGRVTKDGELLKGQDDSDDESRVITELGPKIEIQDPLEVKDRTIFFSSKEIPKTKQEIVQEKSEAIKDQLNTTNQYQKFVNVSLKERMGDIKKLLDKEKRLSEELNCFQDTTKTRHELEKVNSKYITEADTKALLDNLEREYDKMKEKFDYELSRIEKTKSDLQAKRQQIDTLKEEMKFIVKKENKQEVIDDPVLTLRHELKKLGIPDDSGKITEALRMLSKKMNQIP
jgi:asparagine synthetase A